MKRQLKVLPRYRRCRAKTKYNYQCWNYAIDGSDYCWHHSAKKLMQQEFTQYRDNPVIIAKEVVR